jgi:putative membrane protein
VTDAPKPFVQEIEAAPDPGLAPPVPDEALAGGAALPALAALGRRRGPWGFALSALGALVVFAAGVAAHDFVAGLLARNAVLGAIALALVGLAVLAALILAWREAGAFLRLRRLDGLRARGEAAHAAADLTGARAVVQDLTRLYASRPDTAWGRSRLADRAAEVMDADALLALAEVELLAPLDAQARLAVEGAARQVALVTALVPLALADVAAALVANLAMVREIAQVYGGRSGTFGSLRLLRRVVTALVAAGALALTDDMIGSVAGGGVLSRLSRRFGEGVVNGALTARVGLAAMDLCRPLPFRAAPRPGVTDLVTAALAGLVPRRRG